MTDRADDITIRLAEAKDMVAIADMSMQALAYSERPMGPDDGMAPEAYIAKMTADGPGGLNLCGFILAEKNNQLVGFLQFTQGYDIKYPGPTAKLEEIFVIPDLRRQKIGLRLMIIFAKFAEDIGWQAIHWNVGRLDIDARVFFDVLMEDSFKLHRLNYSIEGDEIGAMAARG